MAVMVLVGLLEARGQTDRQRREAPGLKHVDNKCIKTNWGQTILSSAAIAFVHLERSMKHMINEPTAA